MSKLEKVVIDTLKENKGQIVDYINKKVNIPLVSEANEEKIFSAIADCAIEAVEEVLSK